MSDKAFTLTDNDIEKLCTAGSRAPSGGNSQPWLVKVNRNTLSIYLDPKRSESFLDVGYYASFFSIGCFLENLTIEALSLGFDFTTTIHDEENITEPLITMTFHGRNNKQSVNQSLQPYIEKRITNRHIYNGMAIEEDKIEQLRKEVRKNNDFYLFSESSRLGKEKIADILGQADAIRILNENTYKEMIQEFRWDKKEVESTNDGLDIKTLEMPKNAEKLYRLLKDYPSIRQLMPWEAFAGMAKPLLTGCSHLGCFYTSGALTPNNMIVAGSIFERAWLLATKFGIALQPWSILPFFLIRVNKYEGKGFTKSEVEILKTIEEKFYQRLGLSSKETPLFVFRLSYTNKQPSAHPLRIPWTDFTHISS